MKMKTLLRSLATLFVIISLVTTPLVATAADRKGDKNYKEGLKYEIAEQWDKAAEEFALAVAARPQDAEYRLHYRRALFNASQMMMQRGRVFAEQKNYVAGYNAFRQAFGYDATNELAKAEMDRMLRLQKQAEDPDDPNKPKESPTAQPPGVKLIPTSYNVQPGQPQQQDTQLEALRDIKFSDVDLKNVIKDLAQSLDLNVLFDSDTFRQGAARKLTVELKNVTTAQALDYIFLQEKLFFQKVGKRTVIIADTRTQRQNYQQLVLRTFYLANAKPEDVRNVITQAIPPQPGRPPSQAIVDKDTNSVTVRDTSENIKIIADLIKAVDKDRAEVVMDVNIYEVSKSDLLQLGNQIGNESSLINLGGSTSGVVGIGGNDIFGRVISTATSTAGSLPLAIGTGILLPAATLQAFQSKKNAKLLASTQVHAFNGEESQTRIGQRVPVQTAQVSGFTSQTTTGQGTQGAFGSTGYPVINYEQIGLTLKFTPQVFPNQDVQVKMSIESKDVLNRSLTPTFTERSISGTARIQNNRTLLLASIAQNSQSDGRQGLPFLGLIPILGRLFSAPTKDNSQTDIVIAVTPRVLRAPSILPEDENERPTGSIASPTSSSLSDMIRREDQEDNIAAARRLTNTAKIQLPDQKLEETAAPAYVPANPANQTNTTATSTVSAPANLPEITPKPIDATVKTLNLEQTSQRLNESFDNRLAAPSAELKIAPLGVLKKGEERLVAVMVNSPVALRLAVLSLGYDPSKIKISRVMYGNVFGADLAQKDTPMFAASGGMMMVTLQAKQNNVAHGTGVLAYLEIKALSDGEANLQINNVSSSLIGINGENLN
ncbi:MAG: secretin N-terminal domain-containing protein [Pyrinomonadaceae bacterium]